MASSSAFAGAKVQARVTVKSTRANTLIMANTSGPKKVSATRQTFFSPGLIEKRSHGESPGPASRRSWRAMQPWGDFNAFGLRVCALPTKPPFDGVGGGGGLVLTTVLQTRQITAFLLSSDECVELTISTVEAEAGFSVAFRHRSLSLPPLHARPLFLPFSFCRAPRLRVARLASATRALPSVALLPLCEY